MTSEEAGPWTRVETLAEGQAVLVRVGGDIDQSTVAKLDEGLDDGIKQAKGAEALLLVVDLQEVGMLASVGLSSLIRAHHQTRDEGLELVVVVNPDHHLTRLLWTTALTQILTVAGSVEEALTHTPRNPA
ncbi:anti-anti-sigma factor [Saccharothrix tamanrassetensis]|uniref:Anti-anti-sigma factor n=1 Tax=Saccharothrix tamanrassetensis TaxID=1051531 RepID=A0A841CBJ2_9PSEU|nr:STAS domain-containing protein [Saccharothrix tamanrassetensis]MBB5953724.1 anti-anti-sigma factor [Saccharothrix tamanrassetensis]